MSEPPVDFVPDPAPAPRSPRRGGPRPGSGAPRGNLNAFKHGRYSRFRDLIPPDRPVASGAARRLITREQRIAERHAANLLALARLARYRADCVAAVESGTPLPPPPLITERDIDLAAITRLLGDIASHTARERQRAVGLLTPEGESIAGDRSFARSIERILPFAFAALLTTASPNNNPEVQSIPTTARESAPPKQPTDPDSPRPSRKKSRSINARHSEGHPHTAQPNPLLPNPEGRAKP